jgi:hypothetical protein
VDAIQEEMEAMIGANNEEFEVLQGTLFSRINIHQARKESTQEENISRKDGGCNTFHPFRIRGDRETLVGRRPVICQPKDAGP